ncbi:uncharacterized protein METZ01_LOCUS53823 [marine metagenome]|uniref:Uncharacterized protein n=1 Tax=marine metagenome TaxID=408172 RepID=A0A381SBU4_9ZZZZ
MFTPFQTVCDFGVVRLPNGVVATPYLEDNLAFFEVSQC